MYQVDLCYTDRHRIEDLVNVAKNQILLHTVMSYMDWLWVHLPYGLSIQHLLRRFADAMRHLFWIDEDTNGSTTMLTAILKRSFKFKKISSGHFDNHSELQKIMICESGVTIGMSYRSCRTCSHRLGEHRAKKKLPVDNETDIFRGT